MDEKKPDWNILFRQMPEVRKNWKRFLLAGIFLIILGGLAVSYAGLTTEFAVIFLGFLLIGGGVVQIASSYYSLKWSGSPASFLLGILYIIVGGLCIIKPVQSAESITLLIAALLLVGGLFRLFSALYHRFDYWGWMVFSGIISTFLGILILVEWPASGLWVIGLFIGIELILVGWSWVLLSLAARE